MSSQGQRRLVSQVSLSEGDPIALNPRRHFLAQRVEDNPSIYLLSKPLSFSSKASRTSDLRIVLQQPIPSSSVSFPSERCIEEDVIIMLLTMPGLCRKLFYVLLGSTPNLQELCQRREQLAPSLLAMEAQQIVAHDLLQSPHLLEISRRKLSPRVLLFSDNGFRTNDAVTLLLLFLLLLYQQTLIRGFFDCS